MLKRALTLLLLVASSGVAVAGTTSVVSKHKATDVTAPEAITTLVASAPNSSSCLLAWTAPHEDGASGGAVTSYDCRVCTQGTCSTTMDNTEYGAATGITITGEPSPPASPGSAESFRAAGLAASTAYVFGCKSQDEVPNVSAVSTGGTPTCTTTALSFCDGAFQYCDDFSSGTLATNWTQQRGTWTTGSGILTGPTTGASDLSLEWTVDTGGLTQYAIVKLVTVVGEKGVFLRGGSALVNDERYELYWHQSDSKVYWSAVHDSSGSWMEDIATCDLTFSTNDYLEASISGVGASAIVKVWRVTSDPTAAPSASPSCTFTVGTGCASASPATACACLATTCTPANNADSGLKVGIHEYDATTSPSKTYDNFAGGGS